MIDQIKAKFDNVVETESAIFEESYRVMLDPKEKESVEKFIDELVSQQTENYKKSYVNDSILWISINEYQISITAYKVLDKDTFIDRLSLLITKGSK